MKFGRRIKDTLYSEWADQYIDYGGLKKQIKANLPWNDTAEADFVRALQDQLTKCETFQHDKSDELMSKIQQLEEEVKGLVEKAGYSEGATSDEEDDRGDDGTMETTTATTATTPGDVERNIRDRRDDDAGSDDDDDDDDDEDVSSDMLIDAIEERFRELEEEVAVLVADVHDLALFTKLNFTGFIKIVKKHDKLTGFNLKNTFNRQVLEAHPFYRMNYDPLIVKLSKLFDLVRTRGHPIEGDASAGGNQNAFVRSTTKYWVHDENIVPLKLAIMKHLPVLVFNPNKEFSMADSAITSIYFDNQDLELYLGRLEKTEGAEAIRMRWYGDVTGNTIFVERKTHREDWTGEKSVKERFTIKEGKMNDFISGRYTMDDEFDELVKKNKKTEKEVEGMKQLANEVQYAIITRKLRPVMRTFYNRTAFQLPGNATVRISLDTELTMVREDNFDGVDRTHGNWRRMDLGINHPFDSIPNSEKELFPYGVLEVKLATKVGEEPPQWIRDLINSHLVEAVPKFSKFIHGCASLLPERVDLVPFWLPQMDQDIRKPVTAKSKILIERPQSNIHSNASMEGSALPSPAAKSTTSQASYHEPISEGEDDEEYLVHKAKNEEDHLRLPSDVAAQARAAREHREKHIRDEAARRVGITTYGENEAESSSAGAVNGSSSRPAREIRSQQQYDASLRIDPLASSDRFDKNLQLLDDKSMKKLQEAAKNRREDQVEEGEEEDDDEEEEGGDDDERVIYVDQFRAPPGKKIAIPVRVEPKVVFAAERTFLKWAHFAILLSAVSIGLLNFIDPTDAVGMVSAGCFTFTSLSAILYCGGMYAWRIRKMRKREAVDYHDRWGPTALCAALLASVMVNLVLRLRQL
ncbi:vacuolar transporter chaperone 4 [Cryptococcus neoformans C23]|uniref:Vacuolar transporter chaperone complex subunit 4 n=2 Tax=Cryptococcus neoformans TaxID=5207 RepID=A0A854QER9_CRYNE|nr:vacuolar transporter chaperone 4 [Cryptococcus neoformans var. grubii H99]AUB24608.1 vacuolar transporter chaperone 4 [Cryptococcus neoformans var. grubii]OWZ32333.1 vacuolar transporter chaperone 4 [Cryptococcus neoformans var. grubii AD2-60a]OWZ44180.1 vacuolar transporter chaperone 4 [Cryptococcus neoformans var. grubii C23]OWZ44613.1 vacuolar transporter chaperone 4 [Cryptococcus neoformans var. grubii AD1-83a]OWZ57803.1 vacuolar transporter chaperone 4 [Cryptococcus neoformans var. gru|eukprot:XP_012049426.1 vacuolar transporter chaperone 4 [Cryptococcus neoformans var. grubii H99]